MTPDRDTDAQQDPIVTEIPVYEGPIAGIVASPDGSRLMVTNYGRDSVSIIDTDSCRVVETVSGVREPFAIATGGPDRVYISSVSRAYDSIEVIDVSTNTVVASHPLALSVSDLVASADGRYVYASRNGTGGADVAVVDTTTGRVEVIDIAGPGTTAQCVRTSPDGARLYVDHAAPSCTSDVLSKNALLGETARTIWVGDVRIRPEATGTNTYEMNRNLLLSDGARADSVPNLEIETGDIVGAGHASATGRFDDLQLFYLQSRGIPFDEAQRLVVRGFFADVVDRLGIEPLQQHVMTAIEARLGFASTPELENE